MPGQSKWLSLENLSILGTILLTVLAAFTARASMAADNYIWLAISMGAIGGLVHEFFQSGGKILFFKPADDGVYLGSVAGMILGAVAGILYVRGELGNLTNPATDVNQQQLAIDLFLAGLGLKGVAEAAAGHQVTGKPSAGG